MGVSYKQHQSDQENVWVKDEAEVVDEEGSQPLADSKGRNELE